MARFLRDQVQPPAPTAVWSAALPSPQRCAVPVPQGLVLGQDAPQRQLLSPGTRAYPHLYVLQTFWGVLSL